MRLHHSSPRRGFTLVEVLVAAGLSMLIMLVVTQAFQRGMDTLSQLKSVGEMQQRLRAFETILRSDLSSDHFESRYGTRVSDQRLDALAGSGLSNTSVLWRPPTSGFFRIVNGDTSTSTPTIEGTDSDGNISTRATDHILHMSVKRDATRGDKMFTAAMPSGVTNLLSSVNLTQMSPTATSFSSSWAEVVYFLDTQHQIGQTPGGLPIYGLYRRVRELTGGSSATTTMSSILNGPPALSQDQQSMCQAISSAPSSYSPTRPLNGPVEIRNPNNRLGGIGSSRSMSGTPTGWDSITCEQSNGAATGSDLLLTDVLSFEIKADWDGGILPPSGLRSDGSIPPNDNLMYKYYEYPFNILPKAYVSTSSSVARNSTIGARRVFDTWVDTFPGMANADSWVNPLASSSDGSQYVVPQPIRVRAIQIKVRVWDRKNKMARQITIVQAV